LYIQTYITEQSEQAYSEKCKSPFSAQTEYFACAVNDATEGIKPPTKGHCLAVKKKNGESDGGESPYPHERVLFEQVSKTANFFIFL